MAEGLALSLIPWDYKLIMTLSFSPSGDIDIFFKGTS